MAALRSPLHRAIALAAAAALVGLSALAASNARLASARPGGGAPPVAAPGTLTLVKGPYLQGLGATGVTFKVELSAPGTASVAVSPAEAGDGGAPLSMSEVTRESAGAATFHALRVDGLAPATAYTYRVTAGGAVGEVGRFTTAPPPGEGRPFRFLLYGDSRSDPVTHAAVVRAMGKAAGDFLVNTGDMVARGNHPEDWAELFAVEGPMLRDRCVFAAVGNHELSRGDQAGQVAFLHYFAAVEEGHPLDRLYGTFRWSNTRFFMLNAMDTWTGDERAWLRAELTRAATEPGLAHRIAVMHWGPFSSGPHGDNKALADGEVIDLMHDRKVDLVLAGHDHDYERGEGRGLKYVVSGGAGAPLYERKWQAPQTRRFESTYHFVEVAVDGDRVSLTARRPTGDVLETCGFVGAGSWDCDGEKAASPAATPAAPASAARGACGCAMPGATGPGAGGLGLALALAVAARRKRRRSW